MADKKENSKDQEVENLEVVAETTKTPAKKVTKKAPATKKAAAAKNRLLKKQLLMRTTI